MEGGLNYLHNYTKPPYVHKNPNSSNILLNACFCAWLSNFTLALVITFDTKDDTLWMTRQYHDHFEWMDAYIERLQFEGYIDSNGAATWELNLGLPPNAMENWGDRAVTTTRNARNADLTAESELNGQELKKIKKHLKQMVDL
ncbi:Proline-rich receptor-like protein kinase PERK14 [Hordeum vulgare]|nr:Proline-rich receptor-like protein kinase PERK14 [Hordeum vulgare]